MLYIVYNIKLIKKPWRKGTHIHESGWLEMHVELFAKLQLRRLNPLTGKTLMYGYTYDLN